MKYGTFLYQTQPQSLASVARRAEELGYDSLWIPEHIILPLEYESAYPYSSSGRLPAPADVPLHDPMLVLSYIAGITSKIRLATGIFVLPIRNPFTTAKAVVSLDVLSGGRFIFGLGIGRLEEEFNAVGMNFKDRALRTREYIELMKQLWTADVPRYQGKTVSIDGFKFMPKPVQKPHPPIVFGGHTDPSLRRAARLGDGWYGIAESLESISKVIPRLREHERAAGRTSPLELTVAMRFSSGTEGIPTADDVRRVAELGVSRVLLGAGPGAREQIAAMEKFRDTAMAKVG